MTKGRLFLDGTQKVHAVGIGDRIRMTLSDEPCHPARAQAPLGRLLERARVEVNWPRLAAAALPMGDAENAATSH